MTTPTIAESAFAEAVLNARNECTGFIPAGYERYLFKKAGIEIVPDPEPELTLPPRPWRIESDPDSLMRLVMPRDGGGTVELRMGVAHFDTNDSRFDLSFYWRVFGALVSAYNAAGEATRKKSIVITDHGPALGGGRVYSFNGSKRQSLPGAYAAVGAYVHSHQEELGLEIEWR